jgi:uncharacterized membrane protein (UPF0127 family)
VSDSGVRARNTLRAALLLVLVLLAGVFGRGVPVLAESERAPQLAAPALSTLVIATQVGRFPFAVELADTPEARIQGLQGRRHLAADRGMLFDFDPPQPVAMWMKDTPIALDMLFLGADGAVIGIARNARPYSLELIRIDAPVRAVLELNAGAADRIAVREGDRVCHPLFRRSGC